MKKSYLCLVFLSLGIFLFFSCTTDVETDSPAKTIMQPSFSKLDTLSLANVNNPYDVAGSIHSDLLDAYFDTDSLPTTTSGIISRVESLANANSNFVNLNDGFYQGMLPTRADSILAAPLLEIPLIFSAVPISKAAKSSLDSFTQSLLVLCGTEQSATVIRSYITTYEAAVIDNTSFDAVDKRILLTTTSIARYSVSKKRRPKKNDDTDWEINIWHIAGGLEGLPYSTSSVITNSVSLGIAGGM